MSENTETAPEIVPTPADGGASPAGPDVAALKEQLLRLAADFDNFRKRSRREQDDLRRFGNEGILQDILPVLDNLDRALTHASAGDNNPVLQGVKMVQKQFIDVLGRYGVTTYVSVGSAFDPERHEAVGQKPSTEKPGTVLEELQKGYVLHDRLLRPARVLVAAAAPESNNGEPAA